MYSKLFPILKAEVITVIKGYFVPLNPRLNLILHFSHEMSSGIRLKG